MMETQNKKSLDAKTVLVALEMGDVDRDETEKSLAELERLVDTAGGTVLGQMIQSKASPDPRTMIGSGKVAELKEFCSGAVADLVVFDGELSPSQIRNLEDGVSGSKSKVRVIDRSMLILDIFALHAVTGEGKLQVELAQLKYTAPRLTGHGTEMSRLGGGIGTRGPGESQLETDRRHMQRRIQALEAELKTLDKNRQVMRASRDKSGLCKVAIVGYTNAGKSTLLNRLTDAGILAQDKLFATLDPTTRKYTLPCGESVLLTDTVGLIRKLPHHLINAFRSTLDEAALSDILLVVMDASDPECGAHLAVTQELLSDLGAGGKPTLYVLNKCDRGLSPELELNRGCMGDDYVMISALTGEGLDDMIGKLTEMLHAGKKTVRFFLPYDKQSLLNLLYSDAVVLQVEHEAMGAAVSAVVDARVFGMLRDYAAEADRAAFGNHEEDVF